MRIKPLSLGICLAVFCGLTLPVWADGDTFAPGYDPVRDAVDTPADEECLEYETATAGKYFEWETCGGGGSAPGGSGSELQYRVDATTLGAVTGSSVSGANITLAGDLALAGFAGPNITLTPTSGEGFHLGAEYTAATGTLGLLSDSSSGIHYLLADLDNNTLRLGDPNVAHIQLQTDGTGNGEVRLPLDSIGYTELDTADDPADGEALTFQASSGRMVWAPGSGGNSFETISTPAGTSPVADASTDTLTITETSFLTITGTAGTDTIDITQVTTDLGTDGLIAANAVALTTDTTGNYVSSATASQGLLVTGTEGASVGLDDCAANQVWKRNAGDTAWECAADANSGGATAWDDITDPDNNADKTITFDNATETTSFVFTSAFGNIDAVQIQQVTGNPTDGTLLSLQTADADVDVLTAGDGTNELVIQDNGAVVMTGTAQPYWPIIVTAESCLPSGTSSPALNTINGTNVDPYVLDYDSTTGESAVCKVWVPEFVTGTTAAVTIYWTTAACTATSSDGVQWEVSSVGLTDDDVLDTVMGTPVAIDDTCTAAADHMISAVGTLTHGWAGSDQGFVTITRDPADAGDDMASDARFLMAVIKADVSQLSYQ